MCDTSSERSLSVQRGRKEGCRESVPEVVVLAAPARSSCVGPLETVNAEVAGNGEQGCVELLSKVKSEKALEATVIIRNLKPYIHTVKNAPVACSATQ